MNIFRFIRALLSLFRDKPDVSNDWQQDQRRREASYTGWDGPTFKGKFLKED